MHRYRRRMTLWRAEASFSAPGLTLSGALSGTAIQVERPSCKCFIRFPSYPQAAADHYFGSVPGANGGYQALFMSSLKVTVEFCGEDDPKEAFRFARRTAQEVVTAFLDWVKAYRRQSWLGAMGTVPELQHLTIRSDSERLAYEEPGTPHLTWAESPEDYVSTEDLRSIREFLAGGKAVPLPEGFLSDGRYVLSLEPPDTQRCVVNVAIGLEVAVRRFLTEVAGSTQRDLLELLLKSTGFGPERYYHDVMRSIVGRTLRGRERRQDRRFVGLKRLVELRNKVVHQGYKPTLDEAEETVRVGREILDWLSETRQDLTSGSAPSDRGWPR